jgi:hypothetical protein
MRGVVAQALRTARKDPTPGNRRCRIVAKEQSIDGGTGNPRRAAMRCCPVSSILRRLLHLVVEEPLEVGADVTAVRIEILTRRRLRGKSWYHTASYLRDW